METYLRIPPPKYPHLCNVFNRKIFRKPLNTNIMKASIIIAIFVATSTISFAQSKAIASDITNTSTAKTIKNNKEADDNAFILPAFPEGKKALFRYIAHNLNYPDLAKENGVEGVVIVQFYIDEEGKITNASVDKGIGFGCDKAALEVVQNMPYWAPARFKGKNIAKRMKLPITFALR